MGRAGGGSRGGGGRSGGGSFSRSGSSFSRSSGNFSRSGMGSSRGPSHSIPHGRVYHHRPPRPVIIHPGYGRRTVIINNSGNTTNTGTNNTGSYNTADTYTQQSNPAPKEITPEQKIARAERLAKEAGDNKKNSVKMLLVAGILLIIGLFVAFSTKREGFEKYNLKATVDVGYAFDDGFTYNGGRTEAACEEFYDATGIPL